MTAYQYLLTERKGHVAVLTINRPDVLNAFNDDCFRDLRDGMIEADQDPDVRCIVLTGAGRVFSAGADVKAFKKAVEDIKRTGQHHAAIDQDVLEQFGVAMGSLSTPVISALNGAAIGLGFTMSLACDVRIASEKATLGVAFVRMGLTPEFGSTRNLVQLVGIAKACELVFNAKTLSAKEALSIGLVNQVVPHDEVMGTAMEMAENIANLPPLAIQYAKRNLYSGVDGSLEAQARLEILANRICRVTADHAEAVDAFLEKRQPFFHGA